MAPRTYTHRVWLSKISSIRRDPAQLELVHGQFADALRAALDPDIQVQNYGRVWRLSEPDWNVAPGDVCGVLGFVRRKNLEAANYDEERHEWVRAEVSRRESNCAHFRVNLDSQLIIFEERRPDIDRSAFSSALSKFLAPAGFAVEPVIDSSPFETWLADVDRVTRFRATLKRPNPRWAKRAQEVRDVIDDTEAETITIEAKAEHSATGLSVNDTFIGGIAEATRLGNGQYEASGFKGERRRFYRSETKLVSGSIEVSSRESSIAVFQRLGEALDDLKP